MWGLQPNVVKACRARYRAAGSKSDPYDAYVLADLLRTDGHRLRALRPQRDATRALRALVRGRDDLVATRVALANQLRALLESFWPGAAAIFADVDSPIALGVSVRSARPSSRNARSPILTYHLRRLRLHGLIARTDGTHRYRVTRTGLRTALFFTRSYARVLRPGLAHVFPRAPTPTSELRRTFDALEAAMDRWCADAKLAA